MCKFFDILCFVLKIYHDFESYQNMLITLGFCFLYHKLQLCFIWAMYIILHLHVVKNFWNFEILKHILDF
jgi:hypothetical protein